MVNNLKTIDNGLIIEEPKIVLPWSLQKQDFLKKINDIHKVSENYYTFKIKMLGIPFINCAGLHFEKERLLQIDLFGDEKCCFESEMVDVFYNHQLILENLFGKSRRNFLLDKFKDVSKEYQWKFTSITIKHKLWDRFGMEEIIEIFINS